uniref:Uncharacterized protein n=1 Tax=Timspurckia oligopyrenoides TaxID=708627 RepID=A0A7S0ZLE4_9RHOD|mmetsp:Transcript_9837/g.17733  ORF Transcript_9837/g.17733 Transcript_9837/m.17733 type:complete len:378 (+) Transcript_9837:32-1165(+)
MKRKFIAESRIRQYHASSLSTSQHPSHKLSLVSQSPTTSSTSTSLLYSLLTSIPLTTSMDDNISLHPYLTIISSSSQIDSHQEFILITLSKPMKLSSQLRSSSQFDSEWYTLCYSPSSLHNTIPFIFIAPSNPLSNSHLNHTIIRYNINKNSSQSHQVFVTNFVLLRSLLYSDSRIELLGELESIWNSFNTKINTNRNDLDPRNSNQHPLFLVCGEYSREMGMHNGKYELFCSIRNVSLCPVSILGIVLSISQKRIIIYSQTHHLIQHFKRNEHNLNEHIGYVFVIEIESPLNSAINTETCIGTQVVVDSIIITRVKKMHTNYTEKYHSLLYRILQKLPFMNSTEMYAVFAQTSINNRVTELHHFLPNASVVLNTEC